MKKLWSVFKLRLKSVFHFFAHFKAAILDSRPDGSVNILWARAKLQPHNAYAFFHDALDRPTPSGVKRAYGLAPGIDEQDGEAIGGENAERNAAQIGDQAIADEWGWFCQISLARPHDMNQIRVDLARRDERPGFAFCCRAGSREKKLAIALHVLALVIFGEAEIERASAIDGTGATGACTEAVDEPRNPL